MANTCRTDVSINASKEAIKIFQTKLENCNDGRYPNEKETPHIVDVFGADAELFIDKVGSKWISLQEIYTDDEECIEFSLESAWYPPSDMLKEMHRQLIEIDSNTTFTARYWDEGYEPIGVIKITKESEYLTSELNDLSVEDEPEFFWDDVIDPSFEQLEQLLNIK
jgi:hypothetical protein|tara:strand:+ start:1155 stop:1652 length:498 start_codon:yes stop_codon:yes gene_type:complete